MLFYLLCYTELAYNLRVSVVSIRGVAGPYHRTDVNYRPSLSELHIRPKI